MDFGHASVLLSEVVGLLSPAPGEVFLDCTLGGAGHAEALLERTAPGGLLVGIDRDPQALEAAAARLERFGERVHLHQASISEIDRVLADEGLEGVDGLLADLGVSSPQIDRPERGFSFRHDGPLDMRMGPATKRTAADLVNDLDEKELVRILREYGEERYARRIVGAIVANRPIERTGVLASIIEEARPGPPTRIHPATRTFQALRIAVNDELGQLDWLLGRLPGLLRPDGRAAFIAFHSLEDRRVKHRFRELAGIGTERDPYGNPVEKPEFRLLTRRAIQDNAHDNPRARSARLRALQKLS